jgi:NADH:ubiquinone reductase (H+-translocating)
MKNSGVKIDNIRTKRVVIVGAGFAGLACAKGLASDRNLRITVIDKNNYHQFQPLLYQVATGILSTGNAAFNLRALLQRHPNIDVKMSEIVSVDARTRTVTGRMGDTYAADYLVLASGSEPHYFGVPGAAQFAYPLYSLDDAEQLRSKMIQLLEEHELNRDEKLPNIAIVIVGSGATGVETAGALADLTRRTPQHLFSKVDLISISLTLVDHGRAPLRPFTSDSQSYAMKVLKERGLNFVFGQRVQEVTASEVLLSDGRRLPAHVTIWAGGSRAARLSSSLGISQGAGGRVDILPELTIPQHPGVYVLGDLANFMGKDGELLPQLGSVAKQAGIHCARNIRAAIQGKPQTPFEYKDRGIMAMIGRKAAVVEFGRTRRAFFGFPAFAAWGAVHLALLPSLRIALQAILEWSIDLWGAIHLNAIVSRSVSKSQNKYNSDPQVPVNNRTTVENAFGQ